MQYCFYVIQTHLGTAKAEKKTIISGGGGEEFRSLETFHLHTTSSLPNLYKITKFFVSECFNQ